jgi:hypothetical protein
MKRALRDELVEFSRAVLAFGKRLIRKSLNGFFHSPALDALILVNWHKKSPPDIIF